MVNVIKTLNADFQCQVVCNSHLTECFKAKTEVGEGCIISLFLFNLTIDRLMRETIKDNSRDI
uniref:Uncharacterized protein n=1 Tax=Arion vulgaris TaxID=1028688 RepID=A0A0B7BKJ4_9EUPU